MHGDVFSCVLEKSTNAINIRISTFYGVKGAGVGTTNFEKGGGGLSPRCSYYIIPSTLFIKLYSKKLFTRFSDKNK